MAFTDKEAAFRYINEYQKDKYDRITILVPKGRKKELQDIAASNGMSLSEFIKEAIKKALPD